MPSSVECENGHWASNCRVAAILIAEGRSLPVCSRADCGARTRYVIRQEYPDKGGAEYELVAVARLYDEGKAESEAYDPMLFALRDRATQRRYVWPFYWTKNRHGRWHVGQFPPILMAEEFQRLLTQLPPDFSSSGTR
jgi:hypothetical protein